MKLISVSDIDYEILMRLSKELQLQENHSQAFPYFWEPASEKLEMSYHDEGEVVMLFDWEQSESYTPEDYAESNPEFYAEFLLDYIAGYSQDEMDSCVYHKDCENDWIQYIITERSVDRYSQNWEQKTDHNPSLFLSDVKSFIKSNTHHLGRNPHTYARSIWRMPKMEELIGAIYRLNKQPKDSVNNEAARFVYKKDAPEGGDEG